MSASLEPTLAARPSLTLKPRTVFTAALLVILALFPVYSLVTGNTFVLTLFTRVLILAIAAVSLNLIMGYGGIVSSAMPPISASAAMRSASWPRKASAPGLSSGRSPLPPRRSMHWSSVRSACAPAVSISS